MANNIQELLTPIRTYTFTNNDLIETGQYGNYYLELVHNLNIDIPQVEWLDPNGNIRSHSGNVRVINANTVVIYTGGTITGTHKVNILQDKSNMLQGRRLFDQELKQPNDVDPTYRLAIGRPGFATKNISISDFSKTISTTLGSEYLLKDNNLSDVANLEAALDNLDTYSKDYIDANFLQKTDQNNLSTLSQYIPASYNNQTPTGKTILTYELAQKQEHKSGILEAESTTSPWTNLVLTCHYSGIQRSIRFNIRATLNTSAVSSYEYIAVAKITDQAVINALPASITSSTIVYACEGMPLVNFVGTPSELNYPATVSHCQVYYDNGSLVFKLLPTVAGRLRPDLSYIFTGTILL